MFNFFNILIDNFEIWQIIVCVAAIALGGLVQTTIGFGMGLVSGPIMLEAGLSLVETVTILVFATVVQCSYSSFKLRREAPFKLVLSLIPLRIIGVFGGVYLLKRFSALDPQTVKQIVGIVLLMAVSAQSYATFRGRCEMKVPLPATCGAFLLSGLIGGFCGMGGPPLVLWVNCQSWSSMKMRGFLQNCFALANPVQLLLLWLVSDRAEMTGATLLAIICLPVLMLSSNIGLKIGAKIHSDRLRKFALAMLAILAIISISKPFFA